MSDIFVRLVMQKLVGHFKNVLHLARLIHRKLRPQNSEDNHQNDRHQQLHHNEVFPRLGLGFIGDAQNRINSAEDAVAQTS